MVAIQGHLNNGHTGHVPGGQVLFEEQVVVTDQMFT